MKKLIGGTVLAFLLIPALSFAITLDRPLAIGSRGPDVSALQQVLLTIGYFKHEVTGYFGRITHGAVALFQTNNNLPPVGSVGPKTRALVNAILVAPPAPAIVPLPPLPPVPAEIPEIVIPPVPATTTAPVEQATTSPVVPSTSADDSPPIITITGPQPLLPKNTQYVILSITTDKPSRCRYGTMPNMEFARKDAFKDTGNTSHASEFLSVRDGYYVYYVQCEASANLKQSADMVLAFTISSQAAATPYAPSQLASALTSVSSIAPWTLSGPIRTLLSAVGL